MFEALRAWFAKPLPQVNDDDGAFDPPQDFSRFWLKDGDIDNRRENGIPPIIDEFCATVVEVPHERSPGDLLFHLQRIHHGFLLFDGAAHIVEHTGHIPFIVCTSYSLLPVSHQRISASVNVSAPPCPGLFPCWEGGDMGSLFLMGRVMP